MRMVSQREMRNQSGELLRAVAAGESVVITNHGRPMAVLSPYATEQTPLERLRETGQTRPPQAPRTALRAIEPVTLDITSTVLLREARGEW